MQEIEQGLNLLSDDRKERCENEHNNTRKNMIADFCRYDRYVSSYRERKFNC